MSRIKARKDGIVAQSRQAVEAWMRGLARTEVIAGDARFVAPPTIEAAIGSVRRQRAQRLRG